MKVMYKTFSTPKYRYVYDGNANSIIRISDAQFESLGRIERGAEKEDDYTVLELLQRQGLCKQCKLEAIEHTATLYMEDILSRRVERALLQVTQNCNLRCDYCAYSGSYKNRKHDNKRMSLETAQKAIDFLISHSIDSDEVGLGFYGGEPLLEFELIKNCVAYVKHKYPDKNFKYAITTNGTLLNKEIVEFFIENDFNLLLSLDGPKEVHDLNRRFANGEGSFDIIMKNIGFIKDNYYDYYKKIAVNSVITPEHDLKCVSEFYDVNETLEMISIVSSYMSPFYFPGEIRYEDATKIVNKHEMFKVLLWMLGKIEVKHIPKMFHSRKSLIITKYEKTKKNSGLPKVCHPAGPCLAGVMKLFVNVDGNLYPCERVSEESEAMKIGDLDKGFNVEKVCYIMNVGKITEEECSNCWAFSQCTACAAVADDLSGQLSKKMKLAGCPGVRQDAMTDLRDICFLQEHGYDFVNEEEYIYD